VSLISSQRSLKVNDWMTIFYQNNKNLGTPRLLFSSFVGKKEDGPRVVLSAILNGEFVENLKLGLPKTKKKLEWHVSGKFEKIKSDVNYVIGPNVDLSQIPDCILHTLIESKSTFLTPASWVNPTLVVKHGIPLERIKVWPSGLENKIFEIPPKKKKVLIYEKSLRSSPLTESELQNLRQIINSLGYQTEYFSYGSYSLKDFLKIASESPFAIWLGETESQGLALLQCWMRGTPTLTREASTYIDGEIEYAASSAPYLREPFGKFFSGRIPKKSEIEEFISRIDAKNCQENALHEFGLQKAAKSICEIIEGAME